MKKTLRFLFLLLMLVTWVSNGFAAVGDKFTLVTSESDLKAGDVIIIANTDAQKALGTDNGNNRSAENITITGTTATTTTNVQEITLEGASGAWYFNVGTGYLCAANSKKNYLQTKATKDDNSKASIAFSSQTATIKFLGTFTKNIIKFNKTNNPNLFSCYASGQEAVSIYKKASNLTATALTFPNAEINVEEGNEASFAAQTATLKAGDETLTGKTISYKATGDAIFASFEEATGAATLKTGSFGTATITATFAGDDTYQGSSAKYTVTYKEAPKPTLTFSEAEVNVTYGEDFTAPTLTWRDADGNEVALDKLGVLTYESSNTAVATINEATGEITLVKPGTTTIKAEGMDNDENIADASYTLNYKKAFPTFAFTQATITGNVGETLACPAYTLKAGDKDIVPASGDIVFESKDESVATVDMGTGELTFAGEGTTTITAVFGNDYYESTTATYSVEVTDPNKATETATFDFSNSAKYGYPDPSSGTSDKTGDLNNGASFNEGIITLTNVKNSTNYATRFFGDVGSTTFRAYQNAVLTLSVPDGCKITSFNFTSDQGAKLKVSEGTYTEATKAGSWEGETQSLTLTMSEQVRFETLNITYTIKKVTLDEASTNDEVLLNNANKTLNVSLTRTLKANIWNTFCVPFDVTLAGSALEGAAVSKVKSVDEATSTIYFEAETDKIEAGKAYLVKPETAIENPTFNAVTIQNVTPANTTGNDNYQFVGTYSPKTISEAEYGTIFGVNDANKLAKIKANTTMNGIRAYFVIPADAAAKLNFDGETTGISAIDSDNAAATGRVYNLQGQYVGTSLDGLAKGIYVVNGKKVAK